MARKKASGTNQSSSGLRLVANQDNPFSELSRSYVVIAGNTIIPGVGRNRFGAIAAIIPEKEDAESFLSQNGEVLRSCGYGEPRLELVGEPWEFMRRAAGQGLAGIECVRSELLDRVFLFMTRIEEAGQSLPTVLTCIEADEWKLSLTRAGVKTFIPIELLHWRRFDILDRVSAKWGGNCPFRAWDHGGNLFELVGDGETVVLIASVPLLGDWNSSFGAIPFFTTEESAEHYLHCHLGDGQNRMMVLGESDTDLTPEGLMYSLRIRPVADIAARLVALAARIPLATWTINPEGHREDSGYGRLVNETEHPAGVGGLIGDGIPRMNTVSGTWKVLAGNCFELESPFARWVGQDTLGWSGGQALQLMPLSRSFQKVNVNRVAPEPSDLSRIEALEMAGDFLARASFNELLSTCNGNDASKPLETFLISCWDAVTGEALDSPWRFADALDGIAAVSAYEREFDREIRATGAASCAHIGLRGSGDHGAEIQRGDKLQAGLQRIVSQVLVEGYRPEMADRLVYLCNNTLATLHVEYAGYAKDILWSSGSDDQLVSVLSEIGITREQWDAWRESSEGQIDPEGQKRSIEKIGKEVWGLLSKNSRHFLSTALIYLAQQGHSPQLDYAGISIELVKCLELEWGGLLREFKRRIASCELAHCPSDEADVQLAGFIAGKKPPTLGVASKLLKREVQGPSPLRSEFLLFLSSLSNRDFLSGGKFRDKGLNKVIHNFRNGGVHDSPISYETCMECLDTIVGTIDSPGFLPRFVDWKRSI